MASLQNQVERRCTTSARESGKFSHFLSLRRHPSTLPISHNQIDRWQLFFPNFQQIPRFRSDPPSCARASDWSVKCYGESNFCWRRHPLHSSSYFIGYVMVAWLELICWCRFYFKLGEAQGLEAHGLHALSSCVINTKDRGVRVITPILARTRLPLLTSVPVSFRQPSSIKPMCVALQGISHGAQECGLFLERVN